ncbi:MAG: iron ABC transporter permease [Candidatus Poribacteria bacterium]|nr:iron ABC transporter permease [Candidatus Poribacteria bacterium]
MNTRPLLNDAPFPSVIAALCALSVAAVLVASGIGAVAIPVGEQWAILWDKFTSATPDSRDGLTHLYLSLRLPRVMTAYLVGMSLACVGALFQALLRNPLAEPYIIGVSPGASLGVTLYVVVVTSASSVAVGSLVGRTSAAFVGGLLAVALAYLLASRGRHLSMTDILLAGIAIGSMGMAITSYLWIRVLHEFRGLLYWMMGNLAGSSWNRVGVLLVLTIPCVAICWRLSSALNMMLLGEEHAAFLGLNVERFKRWLLVLGTLATAGTVAAGGVIGFVGIIVPHTVRRLVGTDNGKVIPASSLAGGTFLVGCDLLARTLFIPLELPVGMLTAFLGAPFFLYILRQSRDRR